MHITAARPPENLRISGRVLLLVSYLVILESVQAQSSSTGQDMPAQDVATSFQASLAVVIGVLSIMFLLTFILVVYAKFCHNSSSSNPNRQQLVRSNSRFSGIDKKVIESLPFFKFSSLKGDREGLECAVCLSRFEEIEVLRLLPKCKHAFHINCVDLWLEKHSSCPLCRQRINENDLTFFTYSNNTSLRLPRSQSDLGDPSSNVEIFVERAESQTQTYHGSSRFGSFRGPAKGEREEEVPIRDNQENEGRVLGGYNHRIVVSEVVFKNRWSSVSSSDLVYLNSEMVNATSSSRFSNNQNFEESSNPFSSLYLGNTSKLLNATDKRSVSEIIVHPRFREFSSKNSCDIVETSCVDGNSFEEERKRRIWLPIARTTLQWFANRERRYTQGHNTSHSLNV
ncbi:hypothetical protein LguiA_020010 [Lonicera macranthoides]